MGDLRRTGARAVASALLFGWVLAGAAGCGAQDPSGGGSTVGGDEDTGTASAAAGTTFATPDACMSSDECETSGACVAPYDPGAPGGSTGRGPAACVDACIEANDLQRWCLDDEACCGDLRCNAVDGFCESLRPPGGSSGTSGSGSGSTGGTPDTGTGTGDSSGSGSGSSGGGSSSSDGSSGSGGSGSSSGG